MYTFNNLLRILNIKHSKKNIFKSNISFPFFNLRIMFFFFIWESSSAACIFGRGFSLITELIYLIWNVQSTFLSQHPSFSHEIKVSHSVQLYKAATVLAVFPTLPQIFLPTMNSALRHCIWPSTCGLMSETWSCAA